jgi:hypothetical protein
VLAPVRAADMMNQLMDMQQNAQQAGTPSGDTQDSAPVVTTPAPGFMQGANAKNRAIVTGVAAGAGIAAVAGGIAIAIEESNIQRARSEGKEVKPWFPWMAPKKRVGSARISAPAAAPPATTSSTPAPPASPALLSGVKAGAMTLTVKDQAAFKKGDYIVLAPGTAQQEWNEIKAFGSIILKDPLKFDHPAGTVIATASPPRARARAAPSSTLPPTSTPSSTAAPKLGDEIPLPVWIALAVLALCCLGALICACVEAVRHSGRKKRGVKSKSRVETDRSDSRRTVESSEYEDGSYYAEDSSRSYVPVAPSPLQDPMYSYSESQYSYDPQGSYMTSTSQLSQYSDYAPAASYAMTDVSALSQSYVPSLHENRYPNAQAYVNPADNLFYYNTNS